MDRRGALWVVIHISHDAERVRAISDGLTAMGFMIRVRAVAGDASGQTYEIQALSSEAVEARSALTRLSV